jgi:hypothetical protein
MFWTNFVEEIKTQLCSVACSFFFSESHAVYEIMWKDVVESDTHGSVIQCMPFACWITKAADTHS